MVEFLNVDVELSGHFDRKALVDGFGDAVIVLRNDADERGASFVSFELGAMARTLPGIVSGLIALVHALPTDARARGRRQLRDFNIGVQAGLEPRVSHWTLEAETIASLATIGAALTLTVYGARTDRVRCPNRRRSPSPTSCDRSRVLRPLRHSIASSPRSGRA